MRDFIKEIARLDLLTLFKRLKGLSETLKNEAKNSGYHS